MIGITIQNKKLREVSTMLFNGGLVRMIFGKDYYNQTEVSFYTDNPQAADELANFLNSWKDKWHKEVPVSNAARPSGTDDDISF